MKLQILRHPDHPSGGHARVIVHQSPGDIAETTIRIKRREDDTWLATDGWHATEQSLGPYAVEPLANGACLTLGPEIVNQLQPFQTLVVDIERFAVSQHVDWPEDIPHLQRVRRAGAVRTAVRSGAKATTVGAGVRVAPTRQTPEAQAVPEPQPAPISPPPMPAAQPTEVPTPAPAPVQSSDTADPPPPPAPEPQPQPQPQSPQQPEQTEAKSSKGLYLGVLATVLLAVLSGGVWYFLTQMDDGGDETGDQAAACDPRSVRDDEIDTRWEMAQTCIGQGQASQAMGLIERLVAEDHPGAQGQLARWMDPESTSISPLSSTNPLAALRLYSQARDGGEADLDAPIKRICEGLDTVDNLAAETAFNKYCPEN